MPALNLNLLLLFDAVMEEGSVTRAAERLNTSQPAVSNGLRRLRDVLQDELFIRRSNGLQPTRRALELGKPVRDALRTLEAALAPGMFDENQSSREFVLSSNDHVAAHLLPSLSMELSDLAPQLGLRLRNDAAAVSLLENGEADIAIGPKSEVTGPDLKSQKIYADELICVVRPGHPAALGELSMNEYLNSRHVQVDAELDVKLLLDRALNAHATARKNVLSFPQSSLVPEIIATSNLIWTTSRTYAEFCAERTKLEILPLPVAHEPFEVHVAWHVRSDRDPGIVWMRELIEGAALAASAQCETAIDTSWSGTVAVAKRLRRKTDPIGQAARQGRLGVRSIGSGAEIGSYVEPR